MNNLQTWLESKADDIDEWLVEGLAAGCEYFGMTTGIVSRIQGNDYIIRAVYSTIGDIFSPGMKFELSNTYCDAVFRGKKTVTYIQVGAIPSMVIHPVYVAVQLESYIGAPLYGEGGSVIGTVNFSCHKIRQWEFDDREIQTIDKMAEKISPLLL